MASLLPSPRVWSSRQPNRKVREHATMRVCGYFLGLCDLAGTENRHELDTLTGEGVDPALFPVDHAHGNPALETALAKRFHRGHGGAAAGDDILDQADLLPLPVDAFEAPVGAVPLRLLADDEEGETGSQ